MWQGILKSISTPALASPLGVPVAVVGLSGIAERRNRRKGRGNRRREGGGGWRI